ncbi:MAG: hypothetical protein ACP5C4_07650 [Methanomicrobiales archaeon]
MTGKRSGSTAPTPLFAPGEVGIMGSYASFFGFLLIATILSYRQIIWTFLNWCGPVSPRRTSPWSS